MTSLQQRGWGPDALEHYVQELADKASRSTTSELSARIETLAVHGREIHEPDCFEALLASGPGSRPCLGWQPYSILT